MVAPKFVVFFSLSHQVEEFICRHRVFGDDVTFEAALVKRKLTLRAKPVVQRMRSVQAGQVWSIDFLADFSTCQK